MYQFGKTVKSEKLSEGIFYTKTSLKIHFRAIISQKHLLEVQKSYRKPGPGPAGNFMSDEPSYIKISSIQPSEVQNQKPD